MSQRSQWDMVVVGGGLVGLLFARLVTALSPTAALRIAVLDRQSPAAPTERIGLRVSALSPASREMLEYCDVWAQLPAQRLSPYQRMVVWRDAQAGAAERLIFDAAEQGLSELGHIVENDLLRHALWQSAAAAGVQMITAAAPAALAIGSDAVDLTLHDDRVLQTRLLVGADGASSWVRQSLAIENGWRAYGQRGLVTHVQTEKPHAQTAWQRFLPDGPLAFLPLADGRSSIVWSCPDAQAEALLALDAHALGQQLTVASQQQLGEITVSEPARAFPLAAAHAQRYVQERCALLGDAAHQIHPLAGQGVNLGMLDAAVLADELVSHLRQPGSDPGDLRPLGRYQRRRKGDNLATLGGMDILNSLFSRGSPGTATFAARGLGLVQRFSPLKRELAEHALGQRASQLSWLRH